MTEFLFSYGTLQKEKVQLDLFGRILPSQPDVLNGYKILTIEIDDNAFLSKGEEKYQKTVAASNNNADSIAGVVLEVTAEELAAADRYEPRNYRRLKVVLESGTEAWLYIADNSAD